MKELSDNYGVYHSKEFTVRMINENPPKDGGGYQRDKSPHAMSLARAGMLARSFMERWRLPGHLFITCVPCAVFRSDDEDDRGSMGVYHEGIRHVAFCNGLGNSTDKDLWLCQIAVTLAHEIYHYKQDLDGTLHGDNEVEAEEEAIAAVVDFLASRPKDQQQGSWSFLSRVHEIATWQQPQSNP